MKGAVAWIESPKRARRTRQLLLIALVVFVVSETAMYLWLPYAATYMLEWNNLMLLLLVATLYPVALNGIPMRIAVVGSELWVQFALGKRTYPLGDFVVADLAPGPVLGTSTVRLARRSGRPLGFTLEAPAAELLASTLERTGFFVNRAPPPRVAVPTRA